MQQTAVKQAWQVILADAITDVNDLLCELHLETANITTLSTTDSPFGLRVPRGFVSRMQKGNPNDPLLLQVLPLNQELQLHSAFSTDPLSESQSQPVPGLLHKYHGRVLLTLVGHCAIHCRYCFRRHFPYEPTHTHDQRSQLVLDYIRSHPSIHEVILSGGDPLLVKDEGLSEWVERLADIPHVRRLRIHTRLPIVIPERINETLIEWLTRTRLQPIVVIHCNHANEIDDTVIKAMKQLREAQITVLNQSVLLKNVNDSSEALIHLSEALFSAGVMPYYLHLLDRVQGSAHFEVSESEAVQLVRHMAERLPGYLVPKLVREVAHAPAKVGISLSGAHIK